MLRAKVSIDICPRCGQEIKIFEYKSGRCDIVCKNMLCCRGIPRKKFKNRRELDVYLGIK